MAATARTQDTGGARGDAYTCPSAVGVGDVVYMSAANTVDRAFGGVPPTLQAIGVVITKPTTTTARVLGDGHSGDIYTGLSFGTIYYLSSTTPGKISATPASAPGERFQAIGTASSATSLAIGVDRTSVIL